MGDPAGVGPEIAAAAAAEFVSNAQFRDMADVVLVGHEEALRRGAKAMKVDMPLVRVQPDPSDMQQGAAPEAIRVLHVDNLDMGALVMGQVQAQCGKAAYDYIRTAVQLALDGKAHAVATTPINKESFKAGQVPFIGHTEVLADLTGCHDPLTMFQVHDLRVFFLTRHLSLMDACKAVRKERVLDYLHRCTTALRQLGLDKPRMVVAGLNPHCGEHGLFGHEEDNEIVPAIAAARAEGLDVSGPNPADSVFYFAMQGRWDAVLSLFHDQGHIATKMVDFHRTISLTLGMPILRTSVDHGTAFDIAGQGKVSAVSMVEAIRLAALYAPHFQKNK